LPVGNADIRGFNVAKIISKDVGNWANATWYIPGDRATDTVTGAKYYAATPHTSAAAGTFAADRAANPLFWQSSKQAVPSAIAYPYAALLTPLLSGDQIRTRCPFDRPKSQDGGPDVSAGQVAQRARFKTAMANFRAVGPTERARWYAAAPIWHSFLWYYNYFIMSSLVGNANISEGGVGVIKSIQFKTMSIGAGTAEGSVAITAVDPAKSVVMLYGNSIAVDDESGVFFVSTVYPYVSSIAAEEVKCKWSLPVPYFTNTKAATIGLTVIEYI
jgi:hypothetical protein